MELLLLLRAFPNSFFLRYLFLLFLALNCFQVLKSEAQFLPDNEVQALQEVARKLHNRYWNVDKTFCSGNKGSNITMARVILSNVTCDCTYNNFTLCHVTNIQLKGLNLTGVLPEEFAKLHYLQEIDLSINYLNGSIPKSWASLPLVTLSLLGNRITGTIPKEIGDIITLELLVLSNNRLQGSLPPEIGKLTRLMRFSVSANNVTGKLPETFGNLRNLIAFRIDGSGISGRIPNFIGNWSKLNILDLEGTSMEGPFPSTISLLQNLTNLRVSDLSGLSMAFPELQGMEPMRELVLRNCMITGKIPQYIGETMTNLKILDLSFNRLVGEIPANFQNLLHVEFMYLSNNSLTGEIPSLILDSKEYIDISYNNFTGPSQSSCQQPNVKRISSYLSSDDKSSWCLRKGLPCSKKPEYYSFFINCGGPKLTFEGKTYEEDLATMGASHFFSTERWAYSSTGSFLGRQEANYLARNTSVLQLAHPDLYMTARLSPLSLRYYGLCLRKGSYKVQLHFAEIVFTDDQTFSSLGKRIFDVSIQGETFLLNFNIAEEAGGVGRSITREFNVLVTGSTLEIHLFWSGKGTNDIPDKGVHGPIISAITVTPNFDPHAKLSVGATAAIVCASVITLLILGLLGLKCYMGRKTLDNEELRGLELRTYHINLRQIKAATRNFDPANKIGEGGFGPVYKGALSNGAMIAVKQLSSKSKQGNREFLNEIGMISAIEHPNLVKLYGCCIDGNQLFLIYEYMENNSLASALFGGEEYRLHLDWPARYKICLDIARGLAYLHEESRMKIVHRDIKATNVLLDKDLNAKISDFGLARLDDEEKSHITSRIAGTIGYMAPEYAMRGYLTKKADVYSFGILTLEIVSGKRNSDYMPMESSFSLLDWVNALDDQGNLLELIDRSLGSNYSKEEATQMLKLVLLCTNPSPSLRPIMTDVVSILDGQMTLQELPAKGESSKTDNSPEASAEAMDSSYTEITSFLQDTSFVRSS